MTKMKNKSIKFYNAILAIGMFLIASGFIMIMLSPEGTNSVLMIVLPIVFLICGAIFLFFMVVFTQSAFHLFLGIYFSLSGIFLSLVASEIIPKSLTQWWPILVIFASVSLFISVFYKVRKIQIYYVFPSLIIFILGVLFLLFSFDIILFSFRSFILMFIPIFIIVSGLFLVVLFFLQQKYNHFYIDEEDDNSIYINEDE